MHESSESLELAARSVMMSPRSKSSILSGLMLEMARFSSVAGLSKMGMAGSSEKSKS